MASSGLTQTIQEQERLRAELQLARDDLEDSILGIQDRLAEALDWRELVRRRPLAVIAGGLALGFVLARRWSAERKDER